MSRAVVWLAALAWLGFGIGCLVAPDAVFSGFELTIGADPWRTELRAFYGGIEIGLGLLLIVCALRAGWLTFGLALVLAGFGGIGIARLIAMMMDGVFNNFLWGAGAFELGFALLAAIALIRDR